MDTMSEQMNKLAASNIYLVGLVKRVYQSIADLEAAHKVLLDRIAAREELEAALPVKVEASLSPVVRTSEVVLQATSEHPVPVVANRSDLSVECEKEDDEDCESVASLDSVELRSRYKELCARDSVAKVDIDEVKSGVLLDSDDAVVESVARSPVGPLAGDVPAGGVPEVEPRPANPVLHIPHGGGVYKMVIPVDVLLKLVRFGLRCSQRASGCALSIVRPLGAQCVRYGLRTPALWRLLGGLLAAILLLRAQRFARGRSFVLRGLSMIWQHEAVKVGCGLLLGKMAVQGIAATPIVSEAKVEMPVSDPVEREVAVGLQTALSLAGFSADTLGPNVVYHLNRILESQKVSWTEIQKARFLAEVVPWLMAGEGSLSDVVMQAARNGRARKRAWDGSNFRKGGIVPNLTWFGMVSGWIKGPPDTMPTK
jgi:hypothetical protein